MYRIRSVGICILLCICFAGCGQNEAKGIGTQNTVSQVMSQQMAETEEDITGIEETEIIEETETESVTEEGMEGTGDANGTASEEGDIDYDLTQMGSDMVYATVYQLMVHPNDYIGKKIRVAGNYYPTYYEPTQKWYHYVVIQDALACCSQGMEFVWGDGTHSFPDEYPSFDTQVIVTGIFETYTEEGDENLYCRLVNASMEIK